MTISLAKTPLTRRIMAIDPDAHYAAFLLEDNDSGLGSTLALVSGNTARTMLSKSTRPDLLEFHLIS